MASEVFGLAPAGASPDLGTTGRFPCSRVTCPADSTILILPGGDGLQEVSQLVGSHATKMGTLPEPQPGLNAPRVPMVLPAKVTCRDTGNGATSLHDRLSAETGSTSSAAKLGSFLYNESS